MKRRQSIPRQWLIVTDMPDPALWKALRRLRRGSGILLLAKLDHPSIRRLNGLARLRGLAIATEETATRVHNIVELRRALLLRAPLILLSPIFPTQSHPDWRPLPRMRAASFARLGGRRVLALGGMDARRFSHVQSLGFQGWAGISAFRT